MKKRSLVWLLIGMFIWGSGLWGRQMELADIFKTRAFADITVSADGSKILYRLIKVDEKKNKYVSTIWLKDFKTLKSTELVFSLAGLSLPRFSPEGGNITFLGETDKRKQLFYLPAAGGEPRRLFSFGESIQAYGFLKKCKGVVFTASEPSEKRKELEDKGLLVTLQDRAPARKLWFWDGVKGEVSPLPTEGLSVRYFAVSPDEDKIALALAPTPLVNDAVDSEIYILDLQAHDLKRLTENRVAEDDLKWSGDGKKLYFHSSASEDLAYYYQPSLFEIDPDSGRVKDLLPGFTHEVHDYIVAKAGRYLYFTANEGVKVNIYRLDTRSGKCRRLTRFNVNLRGLVDDTAHSRLYFLLSPVSHPFELFRLNLKSKQPFRLSFENRWAEEIDRGKVETFYWQSVDGKTVEGVVYYPPDFSTDAQHPLIVQIHGGPESSRKREFSTSYARYTHFWTSRGYVVFEPNYRGSTGYGDEVMRAIIGHYFEKDVEDIVSGIEALKKRGGIGKVAVMGWSAGGHLVNWLVTHYDWIAAASSGAGLANWISFYAQTDMPHIREVWNEGPPYTRLQYYREKSPLFYVKNAKTPTIIFCGENDKRVPLPQSREMYRGLKWAGVQTELVIFPAAPHGLRTPAHQLYKMTREFNWIDGIIKEGRPHPTPFDLD
jgi:dipeptidyl aminopeptidase/acylaminoacyl peptidase